MKNRFFIPLTLLALLFVGCQKDKDFVTEDTASLNISINFQTKAEGSDDEGKPKVNSIRVLVFDADPEAPAGTTGQCVFNEYYPFGFTVDAKTLLGQKYYQAALTSRIDINSQSKIFDIYAVLNEDDYELASPVSLTNADASFSGTGTNLKALLSEIEVGVLETSFTDLYSQAVSYATAVSAEPAFLMCAYEKGYVFNDSDLKSPDPVKLQLSTIEGHKDIRTMAQIIVDKITTDTNPDTPGTFVSDLAKVFVLDVSLENVPATFYWDDQTDNVYTSESGLASIPLSQSRKTEETADNASYYQRSWNGQVTTEVEVNANLKQETLENVWVMTIDKDPSWGNPILKPEDYNKTYEVKAFANYDTGDKKANASSWLTQSNDGTFFKDWDKYDANFNNCGVLYRLFSKDEMLVNEFTIIGPTSPQGVKKDDDLSYSDDKWTVNLGDSYYVPENIQSSSSENATCLKVTLAVASPTLDLSKINGSTYPQPYDFEAPSYTYGIGTHDDFYQSYIYIDPAGIDPNTGKKWKDGDRKAAMAAKEGGILSEFGHVVWADDFDHLVTAAESPAHVGGYSTYISGFYRKGSGTGHSIVNQTQPGSVFKWNVPKATAPEPNKVYTYYIPINNNMNNDGSYSVHRNTRYKITLHVTKTAYDDLLTKSAGTPEIGISADVVTEKIDDNE